MTRKGSASLPMLHRIVLDYNTRKQVYKHYMYIHIYQNTQVVLQGTVHNLNLNVYSDTISFDYYSGIGSLPKAPAVTAVEIRIPDCLISGSQPFQLGHRFL